MVDGSLGSGNETRRGHGIGHGHAAGLRGRGHLAPAAGGRIGRPRAIENFDVSDIACQIAAQVPRGSSPDAYNPDDWMDPKEQRRVDEFIVYAMAAATQALRDADWAPKTYEEEIGNRRADRLGHRRPEGDLRGFRSSCTKRARGAFRRSSFPGA